LVSLKFSCFHSYLIILLLQPSLKQKIKGEAKVLAGKIRSDPKKIEAGTVLRTGHAVL